MFNHIVSKMEISYEGNGKVNYNPSKKSFAYFP